VRGTMVRSASSRASSSSASFAQSSMGRERKTGPRGGAWASRAARETAAGTFSALGGSWLHLTAGRGSSVASRFVSSASMVIIARTCWPAVTTSGALFAPALKSAPMPWPTPGAVWRFTSAGRPLAWAKPSAIATTTASWRPST
jgi:hypothetical protein